MVPVILTEYRSKETCVLLQGYSQDSPGTLTVVRYPGLEPPFPFGLLMTLRTVVDPVHLDLLTRVAAIQ